MLISIVKESIQKSILSQLAKKQFGDLVKVVVDVEHEIIAIGGELHSDEEAILLEQGSQQKNLWGINLYPEKTDEEWIEFDSMINIRPSQNNRSRDVTDPNIRGKIKEIIKRLVKDL